MEDRHFRHNFPIVITLAALWCVVPAFGQGGQQASPVRVDAVRVENVQQHRQVTGNLQAVARSRVASFEAGIVLTMPIDEGQIVNKGDVLARLDDRRLAIQLRQVEAQLKMLESMLVEREAQLQLRQSDVDMYERLAERGAVNPKELSDAQLELQVAVARRDQSQRDLESMGATADLLRRRMEDTTIRAPFEGVVVSRLVEVGEWIAEGQAIAEVLAIRVFEVWLDVPQQHAAAVSARDLRVSVHVEAVDQAYASRGVRVIREVDPLARTFSLIAMIEDEDNLLSPGMSVIAWIPTGAMADHLTIHKDAILRNDSGAFVYAVRNAPEQAQAMMVPVQTLFDAHDRVVVRAPGLEGGDFVVVEGNERLNPMQPVRIVTEPVLDEDAQVRRLP